MRKFLMANVRRKCKKNHGLIKKTCSVGYICCVQKDQHMFLNTETISAVDCSCLSCQYRANTHRHLGSYFNPEYIYLFFWGLWPYQKRNIYQLACVKHLYLDPPNGYITCRTTHSYGLIMHYYFYCKTHENHSAVGVKYI